MSGGGGSSPSRTAERWELVLPGRFEEEQALSAACQQGGSGLEWEYVTNIPGAIDRAAIGRGLPKAECTIIINTVYIIWS